MKIPGIDNEVAKHIGETSRTHTKQPAEEPRTSVAVPTEATEDTVVNLSQRSKEIQMARKAMESEPDVRLEKVQAIKKKIENGTYEIDYDKTAEKMLKAFSD